MTTTIFSDVDTWTDLEAGSYDLRVFNKELEDDTFRRFRTFENIEVGAVQLIDDDGDEQFETYEDLSAALADADEEYVLNVFEDIEDDVTVSVEDVTINLQGNTVEGDVSIEADDVVLNGSEVDGNLDISAEDVAINNINVTENVTLTSAAKVAFSGTTVEGNFTAAAGSSFTGINSSQVDGTFEDEDIDPDTVQVNTQQELYNAISDNEAHITLMDDITITDDVSMFNDGFMELDYGVTIDLNNYDLTFAEDGNTVGNVVLDFDGGATAPIAVVNGTLSFTDNLAEINFSQGSVTFSDITFEDLNTTLNVNVPAVSFSNITFDADSVVFDGTAIDINDDTEIDGLSVMGSEYATAFKINLPADLNLSGDVNIAADHLIATSGSAVIKGGATFTGDGELAAGFWNADITYHNLTFDLLTEDRSVIVLDSDPILGNVTFNEEVEVNSNFDIVRGRTVTFDQSELELGNDITGVNASGVGLSSATNSGMITGADTVKLTGTVTFDNIGWTSDVTIDLDGNTLSLLGDIDGNLVRSYTDAVTPVLNGTVEFTGAATVEGVTFEVGTVDISGQDVEFYGVTLAEKASGTVNLTVDLTTVGADEIDFGLPASYGETTIGEDVVFNFGDNGNADVLVNANNASRNLITEIDGETYSDIIFKFAKDIADEEVIVLSSTDIDLSGIVATDLSIAGAADRATLVENPTFDEAKIKVDHEPGYQAGQEVKVDIDPSTNEFSVSYDGVTTTATGN